MYALPSYSKCDVLCLGTSFGHLRRAFNSYSSINERIIHAIIGIIDGLPVVGQIASFAEKKIVERLYPFTNPFPPSEVTLNVDIPDYGKKTKAFLGAETYRATRAIKDCQAAPLLFDIIDHPERHLVISYTWAGLETHLFKTLSECACQGGHAFHRFENDRRSSLENKLIRDALEKQNPQKPLRYLSLGAGECLQDFINLGKLLRAGYRNIEAVLVEPNLGQETRDSLLKELSLLSKAAEELGGTLVIRFTKSVQEAEGPFQIIAAIDFDDFNSALIDVIFAHSLLAPSGTYYLASTIYDLTFDSTACIEFATYATKLKKIWPLPPQQDLSIPSNHELSCVFMDKTSDILIQSVKFLNSLAEAPDADGISLALSNISFTFTHRDGRITEYNNKESLSRFFTLLTHKPVTITFSTSPEELEKISSTADIVIKS